MPGILAVSLNSLSTTGAKIYVLPFFPAHSYARFLLRIRGTKPGISLHYILDNSISARKFISFF